MCDVITKYRSINNKTFGQKKIIKFIHNLMINSKRIGLKKVFTPFCLLRTYIYYKKKMSNEYP